MNITVNLTCPNLCSSCSKQGTCNKCFDGYFWINYQCKSCPYKSCNTCAGTTSSCTPCIEDYVLYEEKRVSTCPKNTLKTEKTSEGCQTTTKNVFHHVHRQHLQKDKNVFDVNHYVLHVTQMMITALRVKKASSYMKINAMQFVQREQKN